LQLIGVPADYYNLVMPFIQNYDSVFFIRH